jgi:electron transfer flavoprotein beta subunit
LNIAVLVKSAVDEAELKSDSSGRAQLAGAQTKMSTFDKNAVEAAVSLKEKMGGSVTALSLGSQDARRAIKEALAMGCDRASLMLSEGLLDALTTSYYLSAQIKKAGGVDLVLCSEGASDTYQDQVGAMVAELLGLPFVPCAKKVEVEGRKVRCEQVLDEGVRVSEAALPCVISVVSGANDPRYPTLLQSMQASKKPIEEVPVASLRGPDLPETSIEVLEVTGQSVARKRVIFEGSPDETARKLVDALRLEGVVR